MSPSLASALTGVTCGVAVEIVAAAWSVKSPNWKSWRWWVAWCAVMVSGFVCFYLGTVAR